MVTSGTGLGALCAAAAAAAYFWLTGRLSAHVFWTYVYPLPYRPIDYSYIDKLWSKLLWFDALVAMCIVISVLPGNRKFIYERQDTLLLLTMGVTSLLALTKVQASHYVFPGAAFLSLFCARVIRANFKRSKSGIVLLVVPASLLVASVAVFRPDAISRFKRATI